MSVIFIILGIALGAVLVIKTEFFLETFGRISWAEEHLGTEGGSRLMYKLIGLAFIFLALFSITGGLQSGIIGFFGPLFGGLR